jgi:hypothetical protein
MRTYALAIMIGAVISRTIFAADTDAVEAKLAAAKQEFAEERQKLCTSLVTALDKYERAARSRGDKKQVDTAKREREAFEKEGSLPKAVTTQGFLQSLTSAAKKTEKAYREAISTYTKAGLDERASRTENELAVFLKSPLLVAVTRDPIVGKWKWFDSTEVAIHQDGTFLSSAGHGGRWRFVPNAGPSRDYVLQWDKGFVDSLSMASEGNELRGKNQFGASIELFGRRAD